MVIVIAFQARDKIPNAVAPLVKDREFCRSTIFVGYRRCVPIEERIEDGQPEQAKEQGDSRPLQDMTKRLQLAGICHVGQNLKCTNASSRFLTLLSSFGFKQVRKMAPTARSQTLADPFQAHRRVFSQPRAKRTLRSSPLPAWGKAASSQPTRPNSSRRLQSGWSGKSGGPAYRERCPPGDPPGSSGGRSLRQIHGALGVASTHANRRPAHVNQFETCTGLKSEI